MSVDVNKILEMLEKEEKPFAQPSRPTVAKESLVSACNGDYDAVNRLLEEDIAIDDRMYNKRANESFESAKECDGASPVGVENPIPSPVMRKKDEANEDIADDMLKLLNAEEGIKSSEESYDEADPDTKAVISQVLSKLNAGKCDEAKELLMKKFYKIGPEFVKPKEGATEDASSNGDNEAKTHYLKDIDVTVDMDNADDVNDFEKQLNDYNLSYKIKDKQGPGGGWPMVTLYGSKENITKWLHDNYGSDAYWFAERIKSKSNAEEAVTEKSPMKGSTDDIVKSKPIDFKSKNNGFETDESKETGKAVAMDEKQTIKAAGEDLISTGENSVFPEELDFDEEAFAELFGLDPETVEAQYVAEDDNIPEHIEIRFTEGENNVLLKIMEDGSLIEEVNAEVIDEPRFSSVITQDEEGNYILLISSTDDEGLENSITKSEGEGENNSEGETASKDEDGSDRTDEFVEGAGLDLDSEYSKKHGIKPAKNATDKIKDPTTLPVHEMLDTNKNK